MVSIVVAKTQNNMIGRDNDFPWYLSNDLKRFRRLTTGNTIIMGRGTYDHLMQKIGKMLPDRTTIVVTRNKEFDAPGVSVAHSFEQALKMADADNQEVFVVGGGQLYEYALPFTDKIYLTKVEIEMDGDTYFPELDPKEWDVVEEESHKQDAKHDYDYTFTTLKRKSRPRSIES